MPSAAAQSLARRLAEAEHDARALGSMSLMQQASQAPALFADGLAIMREAVLFVGARRDG